MANFAALFPSHYLSAADLDGKDTVVKIMRIIPSEEVGQKKDKRPILHFESQSKGLVLNKTNAKRIAKLFGNDTDEWIGRFITLYPSECDFGDDVVACIRVRAEAPKAEPANKPSVDDLSDKDLEELIQRKRARRQSSDAT